MRFSYISMLLTSVILNFKLKLDYQTMLEMSYETM